MLRLLSIENFALIDRLEVEFDAGLNLITGETGSGKSILVDAVGLLIGQRASVEMIRSGFEKARVEGLFEVPAHHPALARLAGAGIEARGEILIRREIALSGGNKVYVNGSLSTQGFLAELGSELADIHGQHDQQQLLTPRAHLQFLDAFGRFSPALDQTARLFRQLEAARSRHRSIQNGEQERLRRLDMIRFQIREIDSLRLHPGLDAELIEEKRMLGSAERRRRLSTQAFRKLYEEERSVLSGLGQVQKSVEELAPLDPRFSQAVEKLSEARFQLEEIAFQLRDYSDSVEFSPQRLEAVEERLAELEKAGRKYGASAAEMIDYRAGLAKELAGLDGQEAESEQLLIHLGKLESDYFAAATELSEKRRLAALGLSRRVEAELSQLAMEATRFESAFSTDREAATEKGIDAIEFLISPNPGESPKPLAKIASGGELSRVILALKSILTLEDYPKTLVFDEIDAGIGGRVASTLGEKLAALASTNQVFCVTHLPQIAAAAARHFHVGKSVEGERTRIDLRLLEPEQREEEIARMLAGNRVTTTTLRQARELLAKR